MSNRWSAEEIDILKKSYRIKSTDEMTGLLPGRTKKSISKKADKMGLKSQKSHWTEEELGYLKEKWGIKSAEAIASHLKRPKKSVLSKGYKIGLKCQNVANGHYLAPSDVAEVLGVETRTVYNWMKKDMLKFKKLKVNTIERYQISSINFLLFLEEYKENWNAQASDIQFIKFCFMTSRNNGSRKIPEWIDEKINGDVYKKRAIKSRQWTVSEEKALMSMLENGRNYKQIAKKLNRTISSIRWKIYHKKKDQV